MLRNRALGWRSGLAVSENPGMTAMSMKADKPAMKRFTSGPATAMRMSRFQPLTGSGMTFASSRIVIPPIGSRIMPFAGTPEPRATRAWPNSCRTTLPKMMPTKASACTAALASCVAASVLHTKTSRNRKVR